MADAAPLARVEVCSWRCGVCHGIFATELEATRHSREQHALNGGRLVCVSAVTWSRDTHNLFDREAQSQHHHQAIVVPMQPVGPPLRFLRDGTEVRLLSEGHLAEGSEAEHLHTQLSWSAGKLAVERTPRSADAKARAGGKAMFIRVGEEGHVLRRGHVIKLGRYSINVRQIVLDGPARVPNFSSIKDPGMSPVTMRYPTGEEPACRICLESGATEEDVAMISAPCLCKGGLQHVHIGCLRRWLGTRYSVVNRIQPDSAAEGAVALSFKPPGCEICKTEFPASFPRPDGGDHISLLPDLPPVKPPFILLQVPKSSDKERPHGERCVFAPGKTEAVLTIGRGHESGLLLSDVTVSREHATIQYVNGEFVLASNNPRFGTMVMPTGPRELGEEAISVQAGRTILRFAMIGEDVEEAEQLPT